jgi:tetratricopeptide (TPR) repeat protein
VHAIFIIFIKVLNSFNLAILKKTGFALIILIMPVLNMIAQDDSRITGLLTEADVLISGNKLPEAMAKTEEALEISSQSLPALQKKINIYFLMNSIKEALSTADMAISSFPEVPEFYYLRGIINNARGKYIKALDDFNYALNLQPEGNLYKYYLGRGVSHLNLLEYEQALNDFSTSIEQNDTIASTYHSRAMANYEIHDYSAAINDFLKALDYSEGNAALYFNLGMSHFRLNEKDKACPYFHKACTMGNNNACRMALMECTKAIPVIP